MRCRPCKCQLLQEQSVKYVDFRVAPLTVRQECNSRGGVEVYPGTDWPCVAKGVACDTRCSRLSATFLMFAGGTALGASDVFMDCVSPTVLQYARMLYSE